MKYIALLLVICTTLSTGCKKGHLTAEPGEIDFGERWVGIDSERRYFQWANQGPRLATAGGDSRQFKAPFEGHSFAEPRVLQPVTTGAVAMLPGLPKSNETSILDVTFRPRTVGDFEQRLDPILKNYNEEWRNGASGNIIDAMVGTYFYFPIVVKGKARVYQQKGDLSLEGPYIQPAAGNDYAPLDFGDIVVNTRSFRTLTLRNSMNITATATVLWTKDADNSQWTDVGGPFSASLASGTPPKRSYDVPPKGVLTLVLTFAPKRAQEYRQAVIFLEGTFFLEGPANQPQKLNLGGSADWNRTGYLLTGRAHLGD